MDMDMDMDMDKEMDKVLNLPQFKEFLRQEGSSVRHESEVVSMGVTGDYAWYELTALRNMADQLARRMENMERVLKARANEVTQYTHLLEDQVRSLKKEVAALKEQAHE